MKKSIVVIALLISTMMFSNEVEDFDRYYDTCVTGVVDRSTEEEVVDNRGKVQKQFMGDKFDHTVAAVRIMYNDEHKEMWVGLVDKTKLGLNIVSLMLTGVEFIGSLEEGEQAANGYVDGVHYVVYLTDDMVTVINTDSFTFLRIEGPDVAKTSTKVFEDVDNYAVIDLDRPDSSREIVEEGFRAVFMEEEMSMDFVFSLYLDGRNELPDHEVIFERVEGSDVVVVYDEETGEKRAETYHCVASDGDEYYLSLGPSRICMHNITNNSKEYLYSDGYMTWNWDRN